jgi:hypothetical protein
LNESTETDLQPVVAAETAAPPAPPRALTPHARRRSWNELPVRVWVVLAVAVAIVTAYFTVATIISGWELRWLLSKGTRINATVYEINDSKDVSKVYNRSDPLRVWIKFELPGQPKVFVEGMLQQLADPTQRIRVGDPIEIRVDPHNYGPIDPIGKPGFMQVYTWTDRTDPRPWHEEFVVVLLLVPLFVLVAAIALWRRRGVMNVWRDGQAAVARVIGQRHTAIAPRSRVVRFALQDSDDRRVFTTLHPSKDLPAAGELMWVVYPPNNPARAIVAKLYE